MIKVYFLYEKEEENELFGRAKADILIMNGNIRSHSADYFSVEEEEAFENSLKTSNENTYCMYRIYKIVHFLEIVGELRVLRMSAEFIRDDSGLHWLLHISDVKHVRRKLNAMELALQKSFAKVFEEQTGTLISRLDKYYRHLERKETIRLINNIIAQYYEMKGPILVENELEVYFNEDITDEQFNRVMPDAPFKLSGLLKTPKEYEEVKRFIMKHAGRLQNERLIRARILVDKTVKKSSFIAAGQAGQNANGSLSTGSQSARLLKIKLNDPQSTSGNRLGDSKQSMSALLLKEGRYPSLERESDPRSKSK